jgi:hypothetical protein
MAAIGLAILAVTVGWWWSGAAGVDAFPRSIPEDAGLLRAASERDPA